MIITQSSTGRRRLSERERQVLERVALGHRDSEIAHELDVSSETVRTHVRNALNKLGARNRPAGVANALAAGELEFNCFAADGVTGA